jgi:hypothetical protein
LGSSRSIGVMPASPAQGGLKMLNVILLAAAAVLLFAYIARRRARLRREEKD